MRHSNKACFIIFNLYKKEKVKMASRKSKKKFDYSLFVGRTINESLFDIINLTEEDYRYINEKAKYLNDGIMKPLEIVVNVVDASGRKMYTETYSKENKLYGYIGLGKEEFNSKAKKKLIKCKEYSIDSTTTKIKGIEHKICKLRNKPFNYVKLNIVIDNYPTLREAIDEAYNKTNIILYITNSETRRSAVFEIKASRGDEKAFYALFGDLLDKRLVRHAYYSEVESKFEIQI